MKHETGDNEIVCIVHGTVCTERCVICHDKTCKQCHYQTVDNGGVTVCEKCNKQRRATLRQLNEYKDDDDKNDDEQHDGNNDKTNGGQSNNGDSSNNTQNNASSNNKPKSEPYTPIAQLGICSKQFMTGMCDTKKCSLNHTGERKIS